MPEVLPRNASMSGHELSPELTGSQPTPSEPRLISNDATTPGTT